MATTTTNRSTSTKNSNKNQKKGNNVNTTTNGATNGTTKVNTHAAPPSSATSMEETSREDVNAAGAEEEESGEEEAAGTPAKVELSKEQKRALFEERDTVLADLAKAEAKVQDVQRRIYEGIGANPITWKGARLTPIKRTLKNGKVHYSVRGSAAVEEL